MGQPAYTFMVYEQVYAENGDPIEDQYVDQNADGVINEDDLIMYHSRDPKVTMAWNNTFMEKLGSRNLSPAPTSATMCTTSSSRPTHAYTTPPALSTCSPT